MHTLRIPKGVGERYASRGVDAFESFPERDEIIKIFESKRRAEGYNLTIVSPNRVIV